MTAQGQVLISIIVSTYNWPEALGPVLDALMLQSDQDIEVIIADDGSGAKTARLISEKTAVAPFPVKHFWQADKGFRLARSRNGAVSLAAGDYLLFMDGDCAALPDFVASHRVLMERGWLVTGKRCFLKKRFSNHIIKNGIPHYTWSRPRWFLLGLFGACNGAAQFLPLHVADAKRRTMPAEWDNAQTCNLGVWKQDFMAIDGFDAAYEGHGREDSDFILRLIRTGIKRKTADHTSPVLHFYHGRGGGDNKGQNENPQRFRALLEDSQRTRPVIGYAESHKQI